MYPKLVHPFSMIIAGPSGCGKTTFTCNLIKNLEIIDANIEKVIWCNSEIGALPSKDVFSRKITINYISKLPEKFENEENDPILVILDDMMNDANSSVQVCELFTKGSHHRNISVVLITQNIFHQSRYCRDISLNAKYIVIFKNPRDKAQFNHLARQIYPENVKALQNIYKEITLLGHSYLMIDLSQGINDLLRFRTNIFNREYTVCYCPENLLNIENGAHSETLKGQQAYALHPEQSITKNV